MENLSQIIMTGKVTFSDAIEKVMLEKKHVPLRFKDILKIEKKEYMFKSYRGMGSIGAMKEGAKIKAYDPEAMEKAKKAIDGIEFCKDPYEASKGADALLILTEWNEFREMDLKKIKSLLKNPLIIDGRNIYDLETMEKEGFRYISIGRKEVFPK